MNEGTKTDVGWSVLLAALLAASPLTGAARPGASLALGAAAGVLILIGRTLVRRNRPEIFEPQPGHTKIAPVRWPTWALLGCVALVFLPTFVWLWEQYTVSIWHNAHGLFIPVFMFVMIRSRLRKLPPGEPESSVLGVPMILGGCVLAVLDAGLRSGFIGGLGLMLTIPGIALVLLGSARTRAIAFPLSLCLFILPLPDRLPNPVWLTSGTSLMMEQLLSTFGVPAFRHQSFFVLPVGMFNVSTNCGGHSVFYGALVLAIVLASTTRATWRKAIILLSVWPVTVFINGIRGTVLVALCNRYGSDIADSFVHGLSGIVTFWAVVFCIMLLADWKHWLRRESK